MCAGHCNGGMHTKDAMKGKVDVLGSKIWTAMALEQKKERPEEMSWERGKPTAAKVVSWGKTEERDWNEVAPLPRGGQGKKRKKRGKRRRSRGDDVNEKTKQPRECKKIRREQTAPPANGVPSTSCCGRRKSEEPVQISNVMNKEVMPAKNDVESSEVMPAKNDAEMSEVMPATEDVYLREKKSEVMPATEAMPAQSEVMPEKEAVKRHKQSPEVMPAEVLPAEDQKQPEASAVPTTGPVMENHREKPGVYRPLPPSRNDHSNLPEVEKAPVLNWPTGGKETNDDDTAPTEVMSDDEEGSPP